MSLDRRSFLKWFSGSLVGGALIGGSYGVAETFRQTIKHHTLSTYKWPKGMDRLRIAAVGDLHVGCPSVNLERTRQIVESINAMDADVVALLGDYLCSTELGSTYVEPAAIAEVLGGIKSRHGTFAVLGNHDWYNDGKGMWKALKNVGITVLENNASSIFIGNKRVWIAGLADDITRTPNLKRALRRVPSDEPVIVLSHDPATFLDTTSQPVVTLSGHTHGGQIAMPFVGPVVMSGRAPLRYAYGHIKEDGNDLIVTSGVGTSALPLRAFACPEIMEVIVQSA